MQRLKTESPSAGKITTLKPDLRTRLPAARKFIVDINSRLPVVLGESHYVEALSQRMFVQYNYK